MLQVASLSWGKHILGETISKKDLLRHSLWSLSLTAASFYPHTLTSVGFGFITAIVLYSALRRTEVEVYGLWFGGILFHATAFYWLPATLERFGGFPTPLALALFGVYCLVSALQFPLAAYLSAQMQRRAGLNPVVAVGCGWALVEFFVPRLFPWSLAHCFIALKAFSGLADILGVYLLSGLIIALAGAVTEFAINWRTNRCRFRRLEVALVLFLCVIFFLSWLRNREFAELIANSPALSVSLVQGNVEPSLKRQAEQARTMPSHYSSVSVRGLSSGEPRLIIWPESISTDWSPESIAQIRHPAFTFLNDRRSALLFGALLYRQLSQAEYKELMQAVGSPVDPELARSLQFERFNSALGIAPGGRVVGRYHKQILMPLGEYLPFEQYFPSLRVFSPNSGNFTPGRRSEVIEFNLQQGQRQLKVLAAPLICYEDLVPRVSREAVLNGGSILVNITNDAWYGKTHAPSQHSLLSAYRAIETRRYLLRATNTGLTTVIDPFGQPVAQLPIFTEGVLNDTVYLPSINTVYTNLGDLPMWLLAFLLLVAMFLGRKEIANYATSNE